jgi:cytidylate kinase
MAPRLRPVIAIDGPAGSGKSTVGKALARRLGFQYVDTGALYRAVALATIEAGIDPSDGEKVAAFCQGLVVGMAGPPEELTVTVDGRDVTTGIRGERVGEAASKVSANPEVRRALLPVQRRLGAAGGVVMDGRDIGTVVFPDAEVKVYLDGALPVRAGRRMAESGGAHLGSFVTDIRERDTRDSTREFAPLKKAPEAFYLDTSPLGIEQVVAAVLERFGSLLGEVGG